MSQNKKKDTILNQYIDNLFDNTSEAIEQLEKVTRKYRESQRQKINAIEFEQNQKEIEQLRI